MQLAQSTEAPPLFMRVEQQPSVHKSTSLNNPMSALIFAQANWHFPLRFALMSSRLLKVYQHEDVC